MTLLKMTEVQKYDERVILKFTRQVLAINAAGAVQFILMNREAKQSGNGTKKGIHGNWCLVCLLTCQLIGQELPYISEILTLSMVVAAVAWAYPLQQER